MRRTIANETWEQMKTGYAGGIGLREIARKMKIPEGTVLSRAKREGWTQRIQSAKALAKREDSLAATPVEAVGYNDAGTRRASRRTHGGHLRARSRSRRNTGRSRNPQIR
jgi:hypothetical protein